MSVMVFVGVWGGGLAPLSMFISNTMRSHFVPTNLSALGLTKSTCILVHMS